MKSKVIDDDAVLFNEIRYTLNKEATLLNMATRSKLTQMRFNAIDHALPVRQSILRQDRFQWGAIVFTALFTLLVAVKFVSLPAESLFAWQNPPTQELEEDTDDALEMYEWLYKNYG